MTMNPADTQQRNDSRALHAIAKNELDEYIKLFTKLKSNIETFVDRTNHELSAMALVIRQKQENVETLAKMADGFFVEPTPPVANKIQLKAAAKEQAAKDQDGTKANGAAKSATFPEPKAETKVPEGP